MHDCTAGVRDGGRFLEELIDVILDLGQGGFDDLEVNMAMNIKKKQKTDFVMVLLL